MKYYLPTALLLAVAACHSAPERLPPVQAPTGTYVGLDELKGFPAEQPGDKWYHENIVYIRPDSLFLEGNPVVVRRTGQKAYSASDGGFYSYSGRIDPIGGQLIAKLHLMAHDYMGIPIHIKDTVAAKKLSLDELLRRGLAVQDSSALYQTHLIHLTARGFEMDSVWYVPFKPDSLPNVFPVGFPDAKRFFGRK